MKKSASTSDRCSDKASTRGPRQGRRVRATATTVFWLRQIERLAQDLVLECILAQQPLQFMKLMLQSPGRYSEAATASSPASIADNAPSA